MIRYIALCGYPKTGKSELQKIISARYGFEAVDDSAPLRQAVKVLYNLDDWHVETQDGKDTVLDAHGTTVRKALGDLGCYLEDRDRFHLPRLAVAAARARTPGGVFVFSSVRRDQPLFFRRTGAALIIEVTRAGCFARDDFDTYDRSCIDYSVENILDPEDRARSRATLEATIAELLDPVFPRFAPTTG